MLRRTIDKWRRDGRWISYSVAVTILVSGTTPLLAKNPEPSATTRTAAAQPDLSTPAGALAAFSHALAGGDTAALAAVTTGDATDLAWVMGTAARVKAFRDLDRAITTKFGKAFADDDAGKEILDQLRDGKTDDLLTDLQAAKLEPPGDDGSATLVLDPALPTDRQARLVRVNGQWRVDLASLSRYATPDAAPRLRSTATAAAALADDVTAGKFKSPTDAAKAIDERLAAAADQAAADDPAKRIAEGKGK